MLQPGTILDNKYRIEAVIGEGGFGCVYRAGERLTGESVAIKELVPGFVRDQQMVQRFIREARATLRLSHPHIARTYAIFQDAGTYYLTMEYLAGGSLAERLKSGPLAVQDAVRIAAELCEALAYAHQEGIVHCDIKPANVMFDERGRVRLADFGIAHVSAQLMTRQLFTATGTAMGTVRYMAPEQLEGVRDDPRLDIYALGAVLYEMLAGRPYLDFETESTPAAQVRNVQRIQSQPPTPLHEVNPRVPLQVAQAVDQALRKKPSERPQNALALKQALTLAQQPPPPADGWPRPSPPSAPVETAGREPPTGGKPRHAKRAPIRRWATLGLVALAALATLTVVTLLVLQGVPGLFGGPGGSSPTTTAAPRRDDQTDALGTEGNPITWSFVPSTDRELMISNAQRVPDLLHGETGLHFKMHSAPEHASVVEAMCSDPPEAHVGSLATFAYVLANERCGVDAELVGVRYASTTYNGQFIAHADSGIQGLEDLEGKAFCRPDPLSASGWIIPELTMRAAGINPDTDLADIVDAGSHDAVVAAVYGGDCDAGATYVDARETIEENNPDVMDKVVRIEVTEDIPNNGVQFVPSIDQALRTRIVGGLLIIVDTQDGQEALEADHGWTGLERHGDAFYDPFRQLLRASGMSIEELTD